MYTLLNPHVSDFIAEPILYKYAKRRALKKYSYLISQQVSKKETVSVLVNSGSSGLVPMKYFVKLPYFLRFILSIIEIRIWKKRNKFGKEVKIYFSPNKLSNTEYLILFSYKQYKNPKALQNTAKHFNHVIIHLSHYHNDTSLLSQCYKEIPNVVLAADADISQSILYKKYFQWYTKDVFIMQFHVEKRFCNNKNIKDRLPKALSVGTFHYFKEMYEAGTNPELKDYIETSGATALHPLRREIYEKKDLISDKVDCLNSPFLPNNATKSIFKKVKPTNLKVSQKTYFSFNIVHKFNEYKFVIVGEELFNTLPGIGSFEAMACGCILLANPCCYNKINAIENIHYLPCKDLNDILSVIKNPPADEVLKIISNNASKYAQEQYSDENLYSHLLSQLTSFQL
jgi:hypothetical protein